MVPQNLDLIDSMINDLLSLDSPPQKKCAAILHPLLVFFKILRSLLLITFPQGFRISKNIGHLTLGSVGKNMFKHMDKLTYRKHWPRGPMLCKWQL